MKRTTLQLNAWWPVQEKTDVLAPQIDLLLQSAGFTVSPDLDLDEKSSKRPPSRTKFCSWTRVSLSGDTVFFSLYPARDGPWMNLRIPTRRRPVVVIAENLFRDILEELKPHECSLVNTNADDLPIFAQAWCKGGLKGAVDCDSDPELVFQPGDSGWFNHIGVELRFVDRFLLDSESIDPKEFARQTGRTCCATLDGFTFDGGWDAKWHSRGACT